MEKYRDEVWKEGFERFIEDNYTSVIMYCKTQSCFNTLFCKKKNPDCNFSISTIVTFFNTEFPIFNYLQILHLSITQQKLQNVHLEMF